MDAKKAPQFASHSYRTVLIPAVEVTSRTQLRRPSPCWRARSAMPIPSSLMAAPGQVLPSRLFGWHVCLLRVKRPKRRCRDPLNRIVRSLFTPPERRSFKTRISRVSSNPLSYLDSDIRTKMGVVRLRRRKWAERDRKRPEVAPKAGPHGSDNSLGMAAFCGFPTADQERKKNVPNGRLGGGRGI
jgi:hypothetical protein